MNWLERIRRLRELGVLGMNERNVRCILDLNPRSRFPVVDRKQEFHELCREIGVPTPDIYGVIPTHSALRRLDNLLSHHNEFVIKPNRGAAGRGVLVIVGVLTPGHLPREEGLEGREKSVLPVANAPTPLSDVTFLRYNGRRLGMAELLQHVSSIISGLYSLGGHSDQAIIQQRVVSDPVLQRLSFQGTADVRVVCYKTVPVMAMLRLPTSQSGGRANLHQGAVGAGVDLATGKTFRAVLRNHDMVRHPDTKESVLGFKIPHWPDILDMARRVSRAVGLGYLGVDIVLDQHRGPLVLEANARPGLAIQIANGEGLLHRFAAIDSREISGFGTRDS